MDPATISAIASGLGGLGGFLGLGRPRKSDAQKQSEAFAADILKSQAGAYKQALGLAQGYDPIAEAQGAIRLAEEQAASTLEKSLGKMNADFMKYGGNAGQDSYFKASTQAIARDVSNPLKALIAEAQSNSTLKRIQALMGAVGQGSNLASGYLAYSQSQQEPQRDLSGSLAMLAQGIGAIPGIGGGKSKSNDSAPKGSDVNTSNTTTHSSIMADPRQEKELADYEQSKLRFNMAMSALGKPGLGALYNLFSKPPLYRN